MVSVSIMDEAYGFSEVCLTICRPCSLGADELLQPPRIGENALKLPQNLAKYNSGKGRGAIFSFLELRAPAHTRVAIAK